MRSPSVVLVKINLRIKRGFWFSLYQETDGRRQADNFLLFLPFCGSSLLEPFWKGPTCQAALPTGGLLSYTVAHPGEVASLETHLLRGFASFLLPHLHQL